MKTRPSASEKICDNNDTANFFISADLKNKRVKEINDICSGIFSTEQLTGGLEILKALALELKFKEKRVFFIQNTLHAWPVGYVINKIQQESAYAN